MSRRRSLIPEDLLEGVVSETVSAVHALDAFERRFCLMVAAGREPVDAFRACAREDAKMLELWGDAGPDPQAALDKTKELLGKEYVRRYFQQINRSGTAQARGALIDEMVTGSAAGARAAAEAVLKQEDRLGTYDAFQAWMKLLIEHGADIEVPLPPTPDCANCGAHQPQQFARAKFADMFKKSQAGTLTKADWEQSL